MSEEGDHDNLTDGILRAVSVFSRFTVARRDGLKSCALNSNAPAIITGTVQARRIAMAAWHCCTKWVPAVSAMPAWVTSIWNPLPQLIWKPHRSKSARKTGKRSATRPPTNNRTPVMRTSKRGVDIFASAVPIADFLFRRWEF